MKKSTLIDTKPPLNCWGGDLIEKKQQVLRFPKFLFVIFFMMITNSGFSQLCPNLVQNPGFNWLDNPNDIDGSNDFFAANPPATGLRDQNAFGEGEVASWYKTNGVPNIHQTYGTGGTTSAFLGSDPSNPGGIGHGIGQDINFIAGQTYFVSFSYYQFSTTLNNFLRIRLGNDQIYTSGFQEVLNRNINNLAVSSISFCFTADANYEGFEILTYNDQSANSGTWCVLDDFSIQTLNINVTGSASVCLGSNFTLNDNVACDPPNVTYQWYQVVGTNDILINNATTLNYTATATTLGNNIFKLVKTITTSIGTCSISQNFNLNVVGTTLSITGPGLVCLNAPFTLTAIAQTGSTYSWSPTNLTTASINQNINNQTTYTCTVQKDGCTYTASRTVNVLPLPSVSINGPLTVCEGSSIFLDGITNGDNYRWYNTNNLSQIIATTEDLTITPTVSPTTYQLTVTEDGNGCTNSATRTITIIPACDCGGPIISGTIPNGTTFSNGTYRITNNITLNGTINFNNCEVKISPNVTVTVNGTLNIRGSRFYACGDMWNGFVLAQNSRMSTNTFTTVPGIIKSTLIEDAKIAIYSLSSLSNLTNTLKIDLRNTIFNRNKVALSFVGQGGNIFYAQSKIIDCIFTSRNLNCTTFDVSNQSWPSIPILRSAYNPEGTNPHSAQYINSTSYIPTTLKAPFATSYPDIAINLSSCGDATKIFQIGGSNLFDYHATFIKGTNSSINIFTNVFQNTVINGANYHGINTTEIRPNHLFINKITIDNNNFIACHHAVNISRANFVTITNNELRSNQKEINNTQVSTANHPGKIGITVRSYRFRDYLIDDNDLYNIEQGILFIGDYISTTGQQNQFFNNLSIQRNNILRYKTTDYGGYVRDGIIVSTSVNPNLSLVGLIGTRKINIKDNTLNGVYRGVKAEGWKNTHIVIDNQIITLKRSIVSLDDNIYGILFLNNYYAFHQAFIIINNNVFGVSDNTNYQNQGIFMINSSLMEVTCNTVENNHIGLGFSGMCDETQTAQNDMIDCNFGFFLTNHALIDQQGSPLRCTGNEFYNFALDQNKLWTASSDATLSPMYIYNGNGGISDPSGYIGYTLGIPYGTSNGSLILQNKPYLNCSADYPLPPPTNPSALYRKIVQDEITYPENPIKWGKINKKQVFNLLTLHPELMDNDTILQAFYLEQDNVNAGKSKRMEDYLYEGNFSAAETENEGMLIIDELEENQYQYNHLLLTSVMDTLTSQDSLNLVNLAMRCPENGEEAVFRARALYGALYGFDLQFPFQCEEEPQFRTSPTLNSDAQTERSRSLPVSVYPNPSKGNFKLRAQEISKASIELFDLQNRKIAFERVENREDELEISFEERGVFYLNIHDEIGTRVLKIIKL